MTEEALAAAEHRSARPASAGSIPVIDAGPYLDGVSGSLETVAGETRSGPSTDSRGRRACSSTTSSSSRATPVAKRVASVPARTTTVPPFKDPIGAPAAAAIVYLGRSPSSVTRVITRRWPAKSSTA